MHNKKDTVINGPPQLHKRRTISLLVLAAVIILAAGGVLLYRKDHKSAPYKTVNDAIAANTQHDLDIKDYNQYQEELVFTASGDISKADYAGALKTLNTIVKNVPQDKITSDTYRTYWSLYHKTGDAQNRKKYALLAAQKLKAEGQSAAAAEFETDANGN